MPTMPLRGCEHCRCDFPYFQTNSHINLYTHIPRHLCIRAFPVRQCSSARNQLLLRLSALSCGCAAWNVRAVTYMQVTRARHGAPHQHLLTANQAIIELRARNSRTTAASTFVSDDASLPCSKRKFSTHNFIPCVAERWLFAPDKVCGHRQIKVLILYCGTHVSCVHLCAVAKVTQPNITTVCAVKPLRGAESGVRGGGMLGFCGFPVATYGVMI